MTTDTPDMPPPDVTYMAAPDLPQYAHSADQMRAFGRACMEARAAAWERAHGFDKYGVAAFIRTGEIA